jgi:hypothetical protein
VANQTNNQPVSAPSPTQRLSTPELAITLALGGMRAKQQQEQVNALNRQANERLLAYTVKTDTVGFDERTGSTVQYNPDGGIKYVR